MKKPKVKIEYLPTIGEPLHIKTAKQGRSVSLKKTIKYDAENMTTSYGITGKRQFRKNTLANMDQIKLTLHNISKHPRATSKQKAWALKQMKREWFTCYENQAIQKTGRNLNRV